MPTACAEMLFSVITITYNAATVLPPTLASVAEQTCGDFEYLLIDGASKDNTVALAQAAPIAAKTIVSKPDKGLYDAMNRGLALAKGRYVIFLNAGDRFASSNTLQIYADAISAAPEAPAIVYGQTLLVDLAGNGLGPRHLTAPEVLTARSFKRGMTVCHQAMAVRRDLAPEYDLRYRFSADYDWVCRILLQGHPNAYTGCTTAHYLSEGLTTANHRASLLERFRIMVRHYGLSAALLTHLRLLLHR